MKYYNKTTQAKMQAEHDIRLEFRKTNQIYINVSLKQLKIYNLWQDDILN